MGASTALSIILVGAALLSAGFALGYLTYEMISRRGRSGENDG